MGFLHMAQHSIAHESVVGCTAAWAMQLGRRGPAQVALFNSVQHLQPAPGAQLKWYKVLP
jgi:hypothetical protein